MATEIKRRSLGRKKISETIRKEIIELYNKDEISCTKIAKQFGISTTSVFRIVKNEEKKFKEEQDRHNN